MTKEQTKMTDATNESRDRRKRQDPEETYRADGTNDQLHTALKSYLQHVNSPELDALTEAYLAAVDHAMTEVGRVRALKRERKTLTMALPEMGTEERSEAYRRLAEIGVGIDTSGTIIEAAATRWAMAALDWLRAIYKDAEQRRHALDIQRSAYRQAEREYAKKRMYLYNSALKDKTEQIDALDVTNTPMIEAVRAIVKEDELLRSGMTTAAHLARRYTGNSNSAPIQSLYPWPEAIAEFSRWYARAVEGAA